MDEFLSYLIVFVVLLLFGIVAFVVYSKKKKAKLRFAQIVEERKKHKEKLERERLENIESEPLKIIIIIVKK
jgi:predicted negative regulator of RcsB-dependent stress response